MQDEAKSEPVPRKIMDVIEHIQQLMEDGLLKPGDKLPTEREFARQLKMSRGSVRIGIGYLTGMGVMEARRGVGTFLADGAMRWKESSFRLTGTAPGFDFAQMVEARLILEGAAAALAAERCGNEQLRELTEEVAAMYAATDCAQQFVLHEMRFHRTVAAASGNFVLASSMDTIADIASAAAITPQTAQQRRHTADMHREIYRAIRQRQPVEARRWMEAVLSPRKYAAAMNMGVGSKIAG